MVRDLFQLNTLYKRLFIGLCAMFLVLAGTYGFLLKQTVAAVVERRSLEADRSELAARVSALEADYIRATDGITIERAHELGFVDAKAAHFVTRSPETVSLRYNRDGVR